MALTNSYGFLLSDFSLAGSEASSLIKDTFNSSTHSYITCLNSLTNVFKGDFKIMKGCWAKAHMRR